MQLACPGADCDGAEVARDLRDLRSSEGGRLDAMAIREGSEVFTFENGAQRSGIVARLTCFAAALQNSRKTVCKAVQEPKARAQSWFQAESILTRNVG